MTLSFGLQYFFLLLSHQVHNKIISLDLAVKDVYQRVWLADAQVSFI